MLFLAYLTQTKSLVKVWFFALFLISWSFSFAQNTGDFRTKVGGNWGATGSWERYNGTSWTDATAYPGQNVLVEGSTVTIRNGHNITVNINVPNEIDSLVVIGSLASNNFTLRINRSIHNTGTINLNNGTIEFRGNTTDKNISGNGAFTFRNLTLNAGRNVNVTATSDIQISNTLTFSADGLLVVGSSSNIVLSTNTASITGANSARYIQLDGKSGDNSQLIKVTDNSTTPWGITYPIGTPIGGYTPITLSSGATSPSGDSKLAVKVLYTESIPGTLRRTYRLKSSGNNNNTTYTASFVYNNSTDISFGDTESNYSKVWKLDYNGSWTSSDRTGNTSPFAVTALNLNSGGSSSSRTTYITLGNPTAYPNVWYTYQSGNWSNWENWTLDPSGTTLVNGLNIIPRGGDEIMILNGVTITANLNNISTSNVTIQGGATLDMAESTNANLGNVKGNGVLKIKGINFPIGNYSDFVAATTGGTVEFYHTIGGTYALPLSQSTFNNLVLSNNTNANIIFTTGNNLVVNNNFSITQYSGTGNIEWRINDATANQRTITLRGNLEVSQRGRITCSSSGQTSQHQLNLYGNLTNYGEIKFFDPTDTQLTVAEYNANSVYTRGQKTNAATVRFVGTNNQRVDCFNTTDFYKIVLDKGIGQQATLTINSTALNNFRLFGPTNLARTGTAPQVISPNALSLINGTLELQGTLRIKSLCQDVGSSYAIPQNAALWVNGAGVRVDNSVSAPTQDNEHIDFYGTVRVSAGELNIYSRGLLAGFSALVLVEGGTLNLWKFRTTQTGGAINSVTFNQTGGIVNVGTPGMTGSTPNLNNYPRFALPYNTCSFSMSGGTLNVGQPTTEAPSIHTGILIASDPDKVNVTGGTVNVILPASSINFIINSTAPFYDLNIKKIGAGTSSAQLGDVAFNDGANKTELARPLHILNNLTLETGSSPSLVCNNNDLIIGGNFTISANCTFNLGVNGTINFKGYGDQIWSNKGTISNTLGNVIINKSSGKLFIAENSSIPTIQGNLYGLSINNGTLNDGGNTIVVTNRITNNAIHEGNGVIHVNGVSEIYGSGVYGNLNITPPNQVETFGSNTIIGDLRLLGTINRLNIKSHNLTVHGKIYSNAAAQQIFSTNKYIITNGQPEAGGLTLQASDNIDLIFPVGSLSVGYTPVTILVDVDNTSGVSGLINVKPVSSIHPNVTTNNAVAYYWKVNSEGFLGINNVIHKTYTYSSAANPTAGPNYRAARFDAQAFTWSYSNVTYNSINTPGTTIINVTNPLANSFNTNINWTNISESKLDGEYTAGLPDAFGNVQVFYSRTSGNWNIASTWSNIPCTDVGCGPATIGFPSSNSIVIIGDEHNSHTVSIDANNRSCGKLQINTNSTLDCRTFTGLNFGSAIGISEAVTGRGKLRLGSPNFPAGDFTNFLGPDGGTVEWSGAYTIPSLGPPPQSLPLSTYYNLIINSNGGNIILPDNHVTIYNDLTKEGSQSLISNTGGNRNIHIQGNLIVNGGLFRLTSTPTNVSIEKNLLINNGTSFSVSGGANVAHSLLIKGNIVNNGTLNARNTTLINITLTGENTSSFSGSGETALNQLTIDKGTNQNAVVNFSLTNTITAPTSWLQLKNGTLNIDIPTTLMLTNSSSFSIPKTARLKISNGTVDIINNFNNSGGDLFLSGTLEVSGGSARVNLNPSHNNNNDIEYAAVGNPSIIVSGGDLYVNGSIRRPLTTLGGSLNYIQTGGTVTIGGRGTSAAPNNTRGVFEIENNPGSNFTMTGGILHIRRSSGVSSFADVYINPQTSTTNDEGLIKIGMDTNTPNITSALTLNASVPIGSLSILNAGTAQNVSINSSPLVLKGGLTIENNATLTSKGFDVTIGSDLNIEGVYNGGTTGNFNTTIFNGTSNQTATLSGLSSFNNLNINKSSGTVSLYGISPSITDLNILSGTLDVRDMQLNVNGNITNRDVQISSTSSGAIVLSGSSNTHIINSENGTFHNITFGGTTNKLVELNGNTTITGSLNFNTGSFNRIFFIGGNQLNFGLTANVLNAGTTTTESKFIKTNGVSSDLGVTKIWPASGTNSFTYAVGSRTTYSPVTLTLTTSASGTLSVVPVSEQHPTSNASTELLLNYYWILKRSNNLGVTNNGTHSYQFPTSLYSGSGGSARGAHLDAINLIGWTQPIGALSTSGANTILTVANNLNSNFPPTNGEFHYTVGTAQTLPNPITPVYSRISNVGNTEVTQVGNASTGGNWNLATNWTLSPTGIGAGLATVPVGRPVVILPGHRMNMNTPGLRAFRTDINGILYTNTTGHNLGTISGSGTLRTTTNILPAGTYTQFVSAAGGTIEYDFAGTNTISNRDTYNNLSVRNGIAQMTNVNLTINGNVTIQPGATLDNTPNNRNITIRNNWTNNGTFSSGLGSVSFVGNTNQTITGTTSFYDVTVNKPNGQLMLGTTGLTTVQHALALTNGHIVTSNNHLLSLPLNATISGASTLSFISGPMRKVVGNNSSFTLPSGSIVNGNYRPVSVSSTSAQDTWTMEYVGANPNTTYDISLMGGGLGTVSRFEYWNVSPAVATTSATLSLTYGQGSYEGNWVGVLENLRLARWNGAEWNLPPGGGTHSQSGTFQQGTVTATNITSFSPFTFGSIDINSPLPLNWKSFKGHVVGENAELVWRVEDEFNNQYFDVERSVNGTDYVRIGQVNSRGNSTTIQEYTFTDVALVPLQRFYYRIRQVDWDGKSEVSDVIMLIQTKVSDGDRWAVYPNPFSAKDKLFIKDLVGRADDVIEARLIETTGKIVFRGKGDVSTLATMISDIEITPGVYILILQDLNYSVTYRIVKL